jgi:hypothetical protein
LILLSNTWIAFGGTNLLDLLKSGKAQYGLGGCKKFIQLATHQTLVSKELKNLTTYLSDSRYADNYYFHYTNQAKMLQILKGDEPDRVKAHREIISEGGYKSIMEYQMTYTYALTNYSGTGFYVAANPFSARKDYGAYQVVLSVKPEAIFFDHTQHESELKSIINDIYKREPTFAKCDKYLQFSLLMNENGIDIVNYVSNWEWLVIFNEDIITYSRISKDNKSDSEETILKKLVEAGEELAVMEYICDFDLNKRYAKTSFEDFMKIIPSSCSDAETLLMKFAKNPRLKEKIGFKEAYARVISRKSGSDLVNSINDLASSGIIPYSSYLNISLAGSSEDFINWVFPRLTKTPQAARNWKFLFHENIVELIKNNLIDLNFVFNNAPNEFDKTRFIRQIEVIGNKQIITRTIFDLLKIDPAFFIALDTESKHKIFNVFLKNATPSEIPQFTVAMDKLGYPCATSYNFIINRPGLLGVNGLHFISAYLQLKKDVGLLTDEAITALNSTQDLNLSLVRHLLHNKLIYGVQGEKFISRHFRSINLDGIETLVSSLPRLPIGEDEAVIILDHLIKIPDAKAASMIPKILQTFSAPVFELARAISNAGPGVKLEGGMEALLIIRNDTLAWATFRDISNPEGARKLLSDNTFHPSLQMYLLNEMAPEILLQPDKLPDLSEGLMKALLSSSRLMPYFKNYTEQQKLEVTRKVFRYNPKESSQFMKLITFSSEMVRTNFDSFIKIDSLQLLLDLFNNLSFLRSLSDSEFQIIVDKITSFNEELNLSKLLRSGTLDFNRSMILALALKKYHGEYNLEEIINNQLRFDDLEAEEKLSLISNLTNKFNSISQLARNMFWPFIFSNTSAKQKDQLVSDYSILTSQQKKGLVIHYSKDSEMIQRAISLLTAKSVNYITEVLRLDDYQAVTSVLKFIEDNYPIKEDYASHMIKNYNSELMSANIQSFHIKQYICKNVNKWHAFQQILDSSKDKEQKLYYKERKKTLCL